MTPRYEDLLPDLRAAYDGAAAERDGMEKDQFKLDERDAFLDRLRAADARSLLEIGAGTGQDSVFFQDEGFAVTAIDLSPEMVRRCREKGVDAHVRDVKRLGFERESFDAVWTLNCLLHVPNADLPEVLRGILEVLRPGGLMFLGLYGGKADEFIHEHDHHEPKRFFSSRGDQQLLDFASGAFDVLDFHTVEVVSTRFQALTLVKPLRPVSNEELE